MFHAAIIFFVIALVSFVLGATGLAGLSMEIGQLMLAVFLILALFSFLISIFSNKNKKSVGFRQSSSQRYTLKKVTSQHVVRLFNLINKAMGYFEDTLTFCGYSEYVMDTEAKLLK